MSPRFNLRTGYINPLLYQWIKSGVNLDLLGINQEQLEIISQMLCKYILKKNFKKFAKKGVQTKRIVV